MKGLSIKNIITKDNKIVREVEGLVLLSDLDDSFIIDLRYASPDNFFGIAVYSAPICAIRTETGEKIVEVHKMVKERGYRIKVWDAYRPLSVQRQLYELFPDNTFVAKPPETPITSGFRPRHNNGMAVDITLVDANGNELEMPSEFDDFTEKASPISENMSEEAKKNINYLMEVMTTVGFRIHPQEWWHFVDGIEEPNPYLDIPLESFVY